MGTKRIVFLIGTLLLSAGAIGYFFIENEPEPEKTLEHTAKPKVVHKAAKPVESKTENITKIDTQKTDLYSNSLNYMPLFSISEIAGMPENLKNKTDALLELSQGFYYLKFNKQNNEVFVLFQNPVINSANRYPRHDMQAAKINSEGVVEYINFGYCGEENEIENAIISNKAEDWEFDETTEPIRPVKHIKYDKRKKIIYTEIWNYNSKEPVKYEMKDGNGNVLSVVKEYLDGESGFRREHIFYDATGKTMQSVTVNYDGANIKWFTYYDSQNANNSVTIESEYNSDGLKSAERIYNQNFQLEKTLLPDYEEGLLNKLKVIDSSGNEHIFTEK